MTNLHYSISNCVVACTKKHVCVRKCGLMHGCLTLICSKSRSFSTRTLKLTILSRAVLARRMESSLVEGSHCPQRSTKPLKTLDAQFCTEIDQLSVSKYYNDVRFSRILMLMTKRSVKRTHGETHLNGGLQFTRAMVLAM